MIEVFYARNNIFLLISMKSLLIFRLHNQMIVCRSVAQPGSALVWGTRGRRFKSGRSDQVLAGILTWKYSDKQIP